MIQHPLESGRPYIAVALNYYLPSFFDKVWKQAAVKVCADGGADRINKFYTQKGIKEYPIPQYVIGDFDSVNQKLRQELTKKGSHFYKLHNQDFNDGEKTLIFVKQKELGLPVVLLGGLGGRFDQTTANISMALKYPELNVSILDEKNFLSWIYPTTKGIITPRKWTTNVCGILPVCKPVRHIKSKGLKWNLDFPLTMGDFISSSNEIVSDRVQIKTSDPVLWMNETKIPL